MKSDKIILVIICITIIFIMIIIGAILTINNNDDNIEEDEIANLQEGGSAYTTDELKNFEIKIINLDNNIRKKIKDEKEFVLSIKEYMYMNGFIQGDILECIGMNEDENKITIQFRLNDTNKTIISAEINVRDNSYEFSDNY